MEGCMGKSGGVIGPAGESAMGVLADGDGTVARGGAGGKEGCKRSFERTGSSIIDKGDGTWMVGCCEGVI
ncbi:hypothetical protein GBA52_020533 [Prunus armeniaca]|nr:hypothetical protein GBA52_020533 [Prunus armeniaca]